MRKSPLVLLAVSLMLAACNNATKAPTTPPQPKTTTTTASTKPAPELKAVELRGVTEVNGKPMANAQLKVMDAITNKPLGIVAAGAGNIVASGAGNIVASGAGNYRLAATQVKQVQTDASGAFHLAVLGLVPGRVARVIATVNGKTVTCLVGGDGKTVGGKAKAYLLAAVSDDLVTLGNSKFSVSSKASLTMSPATTALDNSYKPMIGMLGRLDDQARWDNLQKLMDEASQSEDELEAKFDADPDLAEKWVDEADPATGDLPDTMVEGFLSDAGVLAAIQDDARWVAEDVATEEKVADNLAAKDELPPDTWDDGYAALGMDYNDKGELLEDGKVVYTVPEVEAPATSDDPEIDYSQYCSPDDVYYCEPG